MSLIYVIYSQKHKVVTNLFCDNFLFSLVSTPSKKNVEKQKLLIVDRRKASRMMMMRVSIQRHIVLYIVVHCVEYNGKKIFSLNGKYYSCASLLSSSLRDRQ